MVLNSQQSVFRFKAVHRKTDSLGIILLRKINQTPRPKCRGGEMPQTIWEEDGGKYKVRQETTGAGRWKGSKYIRYKDDIEA